MVRENAKRGGMNAHQPITPPNIASKCASPCAANQGRKKHHGIIKRKN